MRDKTGKPMTDMVERVARAMFYDTNRDYPAYSFHAADETTQATYISNARAAIEAMREPTEDMEIAGDTETGWDKHEMPHPARNSWQAMIDAALNEGTDK